MMPAFRPIPGETPIEDISGLILKGICTRSQLAVVEAENIRKVVVKYLARKPSRRVAPFTLTWALRLHHEMFGEIWEWAGQIRRTQTNPGVPAHAIIEEIIKLFDDLRYWQQMTEMDAFERLARLHHRAVVIHPFPNGNGRWARMLANIHQKQVLLSLTAWPEESVGGTSPVRDGYMRALRAADNGDLNDLIEFHRRFSR
jgi:Fic-DOC domain mobile mystery protein B